METRNATRSPQAANLREGGFTLMDALIGMAIAAIMFVSLYSGLAWGFTTIRLARENSRATQIMVEKMETIRLYTWDQINSNGFIPSNFVANYYPVGSTNSGVNYTGAMTIASSALGTSYADDVRKINLQLNWVTGSLPRTRSLTTYISRNGLQNYIY